MASKSVVTQGTFLIRSLKQTKKWHYKHQDSITPPFKPLIRFWEEDASNRISAEWPVDVG